MHAGAAWGDWRYRHAMLLQVAVLDVDVCGPSIPVVMGLEGEQVHQSGSGWSPVVSVLCSYLPQ